MWRLSCHPAPVTFSASPFASAHSNQTSHYSPTKFATVPSLVSKTFTPSIKLPPHHLAKSSLSSLLRYPDLQETVPVPHPALGQTLPDVNLLFQSYVSPFVIMVTKFACLYSSPDCQTHEGRHYAYLDHQCISHTYLVLNLFVE